MRNAVSCGGTWCLVARVGGLVLLLAWWAGSTSDAAEAGERPLTREPTIWFEDPRSLVAGGEPVDLEGHAATRLVDWDGDDLTDVLVGGGDGHVWVIRNIGRQDAPRFAAPGLVRAGGEAIRVGTGYTGACFADLTADGLPDLVVADGSTPSSRRLRVYENVGTRQQPRFSGFRELRGPDGPDLLPGNSRGRIDVADWNADGKLDLLAGDFEGRLWWIRRIGKPDGVEFAAPARILAGGEPIRWPYNTHPTATDINQDGIVDLVSGINWGYVFTYVSLHQIPGEPPVLSPHIGFLWARQGQRLEIRDEIDDDTTPDFADLNGDGVWDMVSGGFNGRIHIMEGVSHLEILARLDELTDEHAGDLPRVLESDQSVRRELFGLHRSMRAYMGEFRQAGSECGICRAWYAHHVDDHSYYFSRGHLPPRTFGYVPYLAGQIQVNLLASDADRRENRAWAARELEVVGGLREILIELGPLVVDNGSADHRQVEVIQRFLSALPRPIWNARMISIREFLGSGAPSTVHVDAATGVNIFGTRVGSYSENVFPRDAAPVRVDGFLICLAHEIAHTIDRWYVQLDPELRRRRDALLERAGYDDLQYLRSQVGAGFFQRFPQEFLASIGNQWFTSSSSTLELALDRFDRGYREPLHQFLLFAEIFSLGSDRSLWYRGDTTGRIEVRPVNLRRDDRGRIVSLSVDHVRLDLELDDQGYVRSYVYRPLHGQ